MNTQCKTPCQDQDVPARARGWLAAMIAGTRRPLAMMALMAGALAGCDTTERDWKNASAADSRAAYESYLKNHPGSIHEAAARERTLQLSWEETLAANSIAAIDTFLQNYPGSRHEASARDLLARQVWTEASRANSREGFGNFVDRFPTHPLRGEARRRLMELRWSEVMAGASPEAFESFFSNEDSDADRVAEAGRVLGPQRTKALVDQMKAAFDKARAAATTLAENDAVAVRFGGFDFALATVEDVERQWVDQLRKDGARGRFTISDVVAGKKAARSSFTMVEPALFKQAKTTFSFNSEQGVNVGRGQYAMPNAVYVTELPADKMTLSQEALFAMLGFAVAGQPGEKKKEELLQVYGADSVWRYQGTIKGVLGNIDEIEGTGPRGGRLTFLLLEGQGLVYTRGSGRVRFGDGREVLLSPGVPGGVSMDPPAPPRPAASAAQKK